MGLASADTSKVLVILSGDIVGYAGVYLFFFYFIFGCIGSSLLRAGFVSSCGEQGLLFVAVRGLLIAVASLVADHRL